MSRSGLTLMHHLRKALLNLGLRSGGLAGRFALMLYMVQFFGLEEIGLFGIVFAGISIVPAAMGWGLNYFVNRDIAGQSQLVAGQMIRDRLLVTLASIALALVLAGAGAGIGLLTLSATSLLFVGGLIASETLATDFHNILLSLERSTLANLALFVRSAAWLPFFMLQGWLWPDLRNLDSLFGWWLIGSSVSLLIIVWSFRGWPFRAIASIPVNQVWLHQYFRQGKVIYLNDVSMAGLAFADRFIIGYTLGLQMAGIYVLYWQICNAVLVLVNTGSLQVESPKLVIAFRQQDYLLWQERFRFLLKVTLGLSLAIVLLVGWLFPLVLRAMGKTEALQYLNVFWLLLFSVCFRAQFDCLGSALASQRQDSAFAYSNIGALTLMFILTIPGIYGFGIYGAALAMIITMVLSLGLRIWLLRSTPGVQALLNFWRN